MRTHEPVKICGRRKRLGAKCRISLLGELIGRAPRTEVTLTPKQLKNLTPNPVLCLFPPPAEGQRSILESSQNKHGIFQPILIRRKNELIDGRARVAVAIAKNQPIKAILLDIDEKGGREIVLAINLGRRQLSESQLAMIAGQLVRHGEGTVSNRQAAKEVGVSHTYVAFALEILDDDELAEAVKTNQIPLTGAIRKLREKQVREDNRQAAASNPSQLIEIRHGDFLKVLADIPAGSVHCVVTDPMYEMAAQADWVRLGEFANEKLKVGASMFVMVGNATSIATGASILKGGPQLKQHWTYGAIYTGPTTSYPNRHVINCFRDVFWFVRVGPGISHPQCVESVGMDILKLNGPDTIYSEFGQKPESFEELILRYSRPGDLVVDPFCGGGAVAEACQRHGRRCIGSEINAKTFEGLVSRFFGQTPEAVRKSGKTAWGSVTVR